MAVYHDKWKFISLQKPIFNINAPLSNMIKQLLIKNAYYINMMVSDLCIPIFWLFSLLLPETLGISFQFVKFIYIFGFVVQ